MPFDTMIGSAMDSLKLPNSRLRLRRRSRRKVGTKPFRPKWEPMEDRMLLATMLWANAAGGDWDVASNWVNASNPSDRHVPTSADDATISYTGITVAHGATNSDTVNSLTSQASLSISNGTLSIAAAASLHGNLSLSGGALTGSGAVTVTGQTSWTGGNMTGAGTTSALGGLEIGGTDYKYLGRTLENHAAGRYDGANLWVGTATAAGTLVNIAGARFTASGDGDIAVYSTDWYVLPNAIVNRGAFDREGSGDTRIQALRFDNSGTVEVQQGVLGLDGGGTQTGDFTIEAGATFRLGGNHNFAAGADIAGNGSLLVVSGSSIYSGSISTSGDATFQGGSLTIAGLVAVSNLNVTGGTAVLNGTTTVTRLNVTGGALSGSGAVTVTGQTNWTRGDMTGAGTTSALGGLGIGGTDYKYLGRTLENHSAGRYDGANLWVGTATAAGTLVNMAGARFTATGDGDIAVYSTDWYHLPNAFVNRGTFTRSGPGETTFSSVAFLNAGSVEVPSGTLILATSLVFDGQQLLRIGEMSTLVVYGGIGGNSRNAETVSPQGTVNLRGGNASAPRMFEAMSEDFGHSVDGFRGNFSYGTLSLAASTYVRFIDNADNAFETSAEAVYVNTLILPSGSTLDLNGLHLYTRSSQINGTVVGGTVSELQDGGAIPLGSSVPGRISVTGETDDWTFFGRAGRGVTVRVSPGLGSPSPLDPRLNYARVSLLDPAGNVLATDSSATPGEVVTLASPSLPVDGTYRLRVDVPAAQRASTGRYVVGVYDSTIDSADAVINQRTNGTLANLYDLDRWNFTSAALQLIRFDLIGTTSAAIRFKLTGPNGWVGFAGLGTRSELLSLPFAGRYTLEANSDGSAAGSYVFRIEGFNPTALQFGVPFVGSLTESGFGQVFMIEQTQANPLLIDLDADSDSVHTEIYSRRGAPPTRREYDDRSITKGADQTLNFSGGIGTWYFLVYGESVPAQSPFTLRVFSGPVILVGLTPDHYGADQTATLTLSGSGFLPGTRAELIAPEGAVHSARTVGVDAFDRMTAAFDLTGVVEGNYDVRVTLPGGDSDTLRGAFHVQSSGEAKLETRLILPEFLGRHAIATIYVEYANTGTAAMQAPILILQSADRDGSERPIISLDSSRLVEWYWNSGIPEGFSNSLQIYASGATPGLLQPGESIRVPVYYVGLQESGTTDGRVEMEILIHDAGDSALVGWDSLKTDSQPWWLTDSAWDPIFANLTAQVGPTWGDYVRMLSDNASYLGRLGLRVTDVDRLYGFELQQAIGLNPVATLTEASDASLPSPGLALEFGRTFGNTIFERYQVGPLGYGWSTPRTNSTIEEIVDPVDPGLLAEVQQVILREPSGAIRVFSPDIRYPDGQFLSQPGDPGKLRMVSSQKQTFPGGSLATISRKNVYELTEPNGLVTRFLGGEYIEQSEILPRINRQRPKGFADTLRDVNGNGITFGYSSQGADALLTRMTHSSGASLTFTYNSAGRIASVADSAGRTTTYTYDASGDHLLTATSPAGTTTYTYSIGHGAAREHALTSITDPSGVSRFFDYDDRGRLVATHLTGNAERVELTYDQAGKVTITDAADIAFGVYFDHRGLAARTEDATGSYTLYGYDDAFHLSRTTDSLGNSVSYTWTISGSLKTLTDQLGRTTRFAQNGPYNQPTAFVDANDNATQYGYDIAGNLTSTTYADGSIERIAHDALGNPTSLVNRRGQAIGMTYNAAGQVARQTFPDNSTIDYNYDTRGRLIGVVDTKGVTTFAYDMADRLQRVDYPTGRWLEYTYDAVGRRTRMTDSSGFVVRYRYDAAGRLSSLRDALDAVIVTYAYDAAGRLAREDKGNGTFSIRGYNATGRTASIVHHAPDGSINSRFEYTYNTLGQRTGMTTLEGEWTYAYDSTGQLIDAVFVSTNPSILNQDLSYEYDALGNRVRTITNGTTTNYATNALNQYTTVGATTNRYDRDGNLVEETGPDGTRRYTYDILNRLVQVVTPQGTWNYEYDALGNRTAVVANGERIEYLFDLTGLVNVVGSYDESGNRTATFTHGLGLESASGSAGWAYYDFDALGSTAGISNSDGTYVARFAFDPFGRTLRNNTSLATLFGFVGVAGVLGNGDGNYFMRSRYYDSNQGRFLTEDPAGLAGGWNRYAYTNNMPITKIDPVGLFSSDDIKVTVGAGGHVPIGPGITIGRSVELSGDSKGNQVDFPSEIQVGGNLLDAGVTTEVSWGQPNLKVSIGAGKYAGINIGITKTGQIVSIGLGVGFAVGFPVPVNVSVPIPSGTPGAVGASAVAQAVDPNEKLGAAGYGPEAFITVDTIIPYRISFENLGPGTLPTPARPATAPAQRVVVTDQLSTDLDWDSLQFTEFGFGDNHLSLPAGRSYHFATVPMTYNGQTFDVEVELSFNSDTGQIRAVFQSIDPATFLPPDVLTGFLPPEDGTGIGKGYISFMIMPRADLPTGTAIRNVALISFDGQTIIATNQIDPQDPGQGADPAKEALNTLDAGAPTSSVADLPATTTTFNFTVSWAGTDDAGGSGIATYDIYVSTDGTPFSLWLEKSTLAQSTYAGQNGHTYAFYSMATDNVGHRQTTPTAAEATTIVVTQQATSLSAVQGSGTFGGTATMTATLTAGGAGVAGKTITFTLNVGMAGTVVGTATTDADGVATLSGVSQAGLDASTYPGLVGASFAADAMDLGSSGTGDLAIARANQTLDFGMIPDQPAGAPPFTLAATSSSGLPVTFSLLSGPATVTGGTLTITGIGQIRVQATQDGSGNYNAARAVERVFSAGKIAANLTLDAAGLAATYDGSPHPVTATTSPAGLSGVTITYDGSPTAPANAGTYVVIAALDNPTYAAPDATGTLVIRKAGQSIFFEPIADKTDRDAPFALAATSGSGLPVAFRIISGPATLSGNIVTITGAGSVMIEATQPGDGNRNPATPVSRSFMVVPANTPVLPVFDSLTATTITYGTAGTLLSGRLAAGAIVPPGNVAITLEGVTLAAPIDPASGTFSTLFPTGTLRASASPYSVTYAYTATAEFAAVSASSGLIVDKADPAINWANPAEIAYGTPLGSAQLGATITVAGPGPKGEVTYAPSFGTILHAGAGQALTLTVAATDNYNAASKTVSIYVSKATPTIIWVNPPDISYGTPLGAAQLDAAASIEGNFAYTPTSGTVLAAGQGQALSVTFTAANPADFHPVTTSVRINVVPARLTVTADDASKVEGQPNPAFTAHYAGFARGEGPGVLGGALTFRTPADAASLAGRYPITPGGRSSANYAITYGDGTLNVEPKPTPAPTPTPPVMVLGVRWQTQKLSRKKTAKVIVVSFSDILDPAHAQDQGDYHVVMAGKDKKIGTRDDKLMGLASVTYDPKSRTVTLTPRGKAPKQALQVSINASGVLDTQGRPLDGNRDGQPGGEFREILGKGRVSLAGAARSSIAGPVAAEAFDSLLGDEHFTAGLGLRRGIHLGR